MSRKTHVSSIFIWEHYGTLYRVRLYPRFGYSMLNRGYYLTRFNHQKNIIHMRTPRLQAHRPRISIFNTLSVMRVIQHPTRNRMNPSSCTLPLQLQMVGCSKQCFFCGQLERESFWTIPTSLAGVLYEQYSKLLTGGHTGDYKGLI